MMFRERVIDTLHNSNGHTGFAVPITATAPSFSISVLAFTTLCSYQSGQYPSYPNGPVPASPAGRKYFYLMHRSTVTPEYPKERSAPGYTTVARD